MRPLGCLLLAVLLCSSVSAQDKVIEKSYRGSRPKWTATANSEQFATSAVDITLSGAQKKCIDNVLQFIITSVAANVVSVESSYTEQTTHNRLIDLFESYTSQTSVSSARMPYLTNVSVSNVTDWYWERHFDKRSRRYYYEYHLLYPFGAAERELLVGQFLQIDSDMNSRLEVVKNNLDTFTDVAYIDRAVSELEELKSYFFDSVRYNASVLLQTQYRRQYERIVFRVVDQRLGLVVYRLQIADRDVVWDKSPRVTSPTASNILIERNDSRCTVTYSWDYCVADEDNYVEVSYVAGGNVIKQRFGFDISTDK